MNTDLKEVEPLQVESERVQKKIRLLNINYDTEMYRINTENSVTIYSEFRCIVTVACTVCFVSCSRNYNND